MAYTDNQANAPLSSDDWHELLADIPREVANVKGKGWGSSVAKGDGSINDRDAINSAINTGKDVFFPDGTYIIASNLTLPSGQDFIFSANAKIKGEIGSEQIVINGGIKASPHVCFDNLTVTGTPETDFINAMWFTAISNAIAIGEDVYFPNGTYLISSDLTVSSGQDIMFAAGAKLQGDAGTETVTINGGIQAGPNVCFDNLVVDGTPETANINSAWFSDPNDDSTTGTTGNTQDFQGDIIDNLAIPAMSSTIVVAASDSKYSSSVDPDYQCNGTDDQIEIQAAIDALPSAHGKVLLLEGNYYISNTITVGNRMVIEGMTGFQTITPGNELGGTKLFSQTTNPVIELTASDKIVGIELRNFGIKPDSGYSTGDGIYIDSGTPTSGKARDIVIEKVGIATMDGYAIRKPTAGTVFHIYLEKCSFRRNSLGNVKLVGDGPNILFVNNSLSTPETSTYSFEVDAAWFNGGVLSGSGSGIKISRGMISGMTIEGRNNAGTIGILVSGTIPTYIQGNRIFKFGTGIQLGEDGSSHSNAVINSSVTSSVDGDDVVLVSATSFTKLILHSLGDGTFSQENLTYEHRYLDLRRENDRPFRKWKMNLPVIDNEGGLGYTQVSNVLTMNNTVGDIPYGFAPGIHSRYHDEFIGAALRNDWTIQSGTIAIQDGIEHGVVRLTTGATSGDTAQLDQNNIKTFSLPTGGGWGTNSGGWTIKTRLQNTTNITVLTGLYTDSNNYTVLFADPSVSGNFQIRVNDGGLTTDYDTGVSLDTNWHTISVNFYGSYSDLNFDGSSVVTEVNHSTGWVQPYFKITTNENVAKEFDVDYIDIWKPK